MDGMRAGRQALNGVMIGPGGNTLGDWRHIWKGAGFRLDGTAAARIDAGAQAVEAIVARGEPVYGINTGFGKLASARIGKGDLARLQENLIVSHSAGVGDWLEDDVVRLVVALKVASLAHGASGVRRSTIEMMTRVVGEGLVPAVPAQGSVGASGDLAPLAHLAAALMGRGSFLVDGAARPAAEVLAQRGIEPLTLRAKEGLAFINGTQVSTALALKGLFMIEEAFLASLVTGALSLEGIRGTAVPFDRRIHALRPHPGQKDTAAALGRLLADSRLETSGGTATRVQDPYSFRCMPQVLGACLDAMRHSARILGIEAQSVSDNPVILDGADVLSGGNFHAEPVAFAADHLALAAVETASISERRTALLLDASFSGLPPFLATDPGLDSGLMIAQVTAAALVAEARQMAHPAAVDSIPTSAGQEDHVAMATHGARRLLAMARNLEAVVAIELMAAGEACDCHAPLASSLPLQQARNALRERVPPLDGDRWLKPDIDAAVRLVASGALVDAVGRELLPAL